MKKATDSVGILTSRKKLLFGKKHIFGGFGKPPKI